MAFFGLQKRFKFWMEILQGFYWLIEKVKVLDGSIMRPFLAYSEMKV